MDSPRGAVFDGEALYVSHPPFVTALRDTDGDGIAEDRRTLVRGLGFGLDFRGADHTTNGVEMGIDGWLYVAVGDYGFVKAMGADGQEIQLRGGGNVRVRPDGTELEIYTRGTRNDYDLAIDPYLNLFARGNTNDGGGFDIRLYHFVAGATFGYPTLFRNFSRRGRAADRRLRHRVGHAACCTSTTRDCRRRTATRSTRSTGAGTRCSATRCNRRARRSPSARRRS